MLKTWNIYLKIKASLKSLYKFISDLSDVFLGCLFPPVFRNTPLRPSHNLTQVETIHESGIFMGRLLRWIFFVLSVLKKMGLKSYSCHTFQIFICKNILKTLNHFSCTAQFSTTWCWCFTLYWYTKVCDCSMTKCEKRTFAKRSSWTASSLLVLWGFTHFSTNSLQSVCSKWNYYWK